MKKKIFTTMILVFCALGIGTRLWSLAFRKPEKISRQGFSMNTLINMTVYADDEKILDEAYGLLDRLDKELSMYDPSSDISKINFNAGVSSWRSASGVKVPDEVIEAVEDSLRLYELTGGVFNPLIGPVTKLWKINKADNKIPTRAELDEAIKLTDIENLEIRPGEIFLKTKGCVLDLGGIAKGFASGKIISMLKDSGVKSALIDLGGNVHVLGKKLEDDSDWKIGVRDPLSPHGVPAIVLDVHDAAVITSGGYERYKKVSGEVYGHFFDASGNSVRNDLLSVTVVTTDGSLGDGLATAFMVSGYEKSLKILGELGVRPGHGWRSEELGVIFIRLVGGEVEIDVTGNLRAVVSRGRYNVKFIGE